MTIIDFIEDNKITGIQAIKNALCVPTLPDDWKLKPLYPIGVGVYKVDKLPGEWTCNGQLECGCVYPIYGSEGQRFIIGLNGSGLKLNVHDWKELIWF